MLRNPASGRVLEKIGMKREGVLRERVRKWGVFKNVAVSFYYQKGMAGTGGAVIMPDVEAPNATIMYMDLKAIGRPGHFNLAGVSQ